MSFPIIRFISFGFVLAALALPASLTSGQRSILNDYQPEILSSGLQDDTFTLVKSSLFPNHQLRIRSLQNFCDPSVKKYSGYLDISSEKHMFFWFFESRNRPHEAPLGVWMNGGPGGSSGIGLLMENGPCTIQSDGKSTVPNPHSWNEVANMIYLDQPAGVGYSISTSPHPVGSTWEAAHDFYAFVQLFLTHFPEYAKLPFHIMAESHGGQFAPNFAAYLNRQNKANLSHVDSRRVRVNLNSIVIVNGMMAASVQAATSPEYACRGPYAFWGDKGEQCALLRSRIPILERVMQECRDFQTPLTCVPAGIYALTAFEEGFKDLGLNVYDVRKRCSEELSCYKQIGWINHYFNLPEVKRVLGVPSAHSYSLIGWDVNRAFMRAGDVTHDASPVAAELAASGIRILNVAGDADFVCNFMGAFEWMNRLNTSYRDEFRALNNTVWKNELGRPIGEVRSAGSHNGATAGNFTWLRVYQAGHMVPHDQPEVALHFFKQWIHNSPFV